MSLLNSSLVGPLNILEVHDSKLNYIVGIFEGPSLSVSSKLATGTGQASQMALGSMAPTPSKQPMRRASQSIALPYSTKNDILDPFEKQDCLRCYEHGCDGRTFSRIENYNRHLREKNGANTVCCTFCNKSFTRKSNMDKHISKGTCGVIREFLTQTPLDTLDRIILEGVGQQC